MIPGEYNYRDEERRLIVELHTEWTLRHFPIRPDLDDMARRLVSVALSGHEIKHLTRGYAAASLHSWIEGFLGENFVDCRYFRIRSGACAA